MASRSVCDIGGITLRNIASTRSLTIERRSAVMFSTAATSTNAVVSTTLIQTGKSDADHDSASNAANARVQAMPVAVIEFVFEGNAEKAPVGWFAAAALVAAPEFLNFFGLGDE